MPQQVLLFYALCESNETSVTIPCTLEKQDKGLMSELCKTVFAPRPPSLYGGLRYRMTHRLVSLVLCVSFLSEHRTLSNARRRGKDIDRRPSRDIGADSVSTSPSGEDKPWWDICAAPSAAIQARANFIMIDTRRIHHARA